MVYVIFLLIAFSIMFASEREPIGCTTLYAPTLGSFMAEWLPTIIIMISVPMVIYALIILLTPRKKDGDNK